MKSGCGFYQMTYPHSRAQPFWGRLDMGRKAKTPKVRRPKTRLGLPDLDQSKYRAVDRISLPSSDNVSVQGVRKPPSSAVHPWTTIASNNTRPRSGRKYGGVLWRDSLQDWL